MGRGEKSIGWDLVLLQLGWEWISVSLEKQPNMYSKRLDWVGIALPERERAGNT